MRRPVDEIDLLDSIKKDGRVVQAGHSSRPGGRGGKREPWPAYSRITQSETFGIDGGNYQKDTFAGENGAESSEVAGRERVG